LQSIADRLGKADAPMPQGRIYQGSQAGFIGNPSIVSDICTKPETWRAVLRVLKPGAHVLAFGPADLAFCEMRIAMRDAGFQSRGLMAWLYGTGFPKGKPLGKFIDREVFGGTLDDDEIARGPVSHSAAFYDECDIALKPALEPIAIARKPLDGTIQQNLMRWGTGALNIRACRVEHATGSSWPSNVLLDGSGDVLAAFPLDVDGQSASRFFYSAKADTRDRAGSDHPTVKPLSLIQYLVKLATTPGQVVLDPFAGSGTTGEAAFREGRRATLIEMVPKFQAAISRRMSGVLCGPEERKREIIKATAQAEPFAAGTLFAGL
jgi:site-specific DNA-methyltransferase (adenine-specific)